MIGYAFLEKRNWWLGKRYRVVVVGNTGKTIRRRQFWSRQGARDWIKAIQDTPDAGEALTSGALGGVAP